MAADPSAGEARICLFREAIFTGSAMILYVEDGSRLVGQLRTGGYLCWQRPQGSVVINAYHTQTLLGDRWDYFSVTMPVAGGKSYFLLAEPGFGRGEVKSLGFQEAQKFMAEYPQPRITRAPTRPTAAPPASGPPGPQPSGIKDQHPRPSGNVSY